jgi:hypothetical protein
MRQWQMVEQETVRIIAITSPACNVPGFALVVAQTGRLRKQVKHGEDASCTLVMSLTEQAEQSSTTTTTTNAAQETRVMLNRRRSMPMRFQPTAEPQSSPNNLTSKRVNGLIYCNGSRL